MLHMHKTARIRVLAALLGVLAVSLLGHSPVRAADAGAIAALDEPADCGEFLCADQAFKVSATAVAADRIEVIFEVDRCCYLYREKMKFSLPEGVAAALGTPDIPAGEHKVDDLGEHQVFHKDVVVRLPVARGSLDAFTLPLTVNYQGCNEPAGICYLPQSKTFQVAMPVAAAVSELPAGGGSVDGYVSEQDWLAGKLRDGNMLVVLALFYGAGLLLALTPCVLPMVPIVVGLITAGGASMTRTKGFSLSLAYVLGMAATYTAAGVAVAAAGQAAQALFQQTWVIVLFSAIFVAMAIAMFGFFTVQMPAAVQTRLAAMSNQQKAGSYAGVAMMGALSALIVTTCVGPALVAALTVIGQSGQIARGGFGLFAMAMGMGTPLLVVGASAGQLLPKAGAWMDTVKHLVGAMMLGVAVWMVSRIVPSYVTAMLWSVPLAAAAVVLFRAPARSFGGKATVRVLGVAAGLIGALDLTAGVRVAMATSAAAEARVDLPFQRIKSLEDVNAAVTAANAAGKTVMLDFYADWCVSCKEMEHYTFPDPAVREALANTVWLQADVTANDEADQALLKHFGIFAPPSIMFFGLDGAEQRPYRVVGYMKAKEFAPLVSEALAAE